MKQPSRHGLRMLGISAALALAVTLPVAAPQERVDLEAIYKIKQEGFERSQVMEIASYLTDVYGPRLTNSPNYRKAGDWAVRKLAEWGLAHAKLEPWGPFGRGWSNERADIHAIAPQAYPIIGYPKAWTPGTNGRLKADAVLPVVENEGDFEKFRGQLRGKFVLTMPAREVEARFDPLGRRFTASDLEDLSRESRRRRRRPFRRAPRALGGFAEKRMQFYKDEGALALIDAGRGDGGTVFVGGGGSRDPDDPPTLPQVSLAVEHYNRILRTLDKRIAVTLELDIANTFHDATLDSFNVVAEIPGTDKADEVVMLGAHFDSWHAGTGATDNAVGSAVMMEAVRILSASGLKMQRTVRIGLWGGEEQGLLGSRAYVKAHFADRATMALAPEHEKLAGYFNLDNGTGAIRGVYLQGNEMMAPIFAAWMEPFRNLGMTTLAIRGSGGTDHAPFDAVGLPGFQFIQDPVEYDTRTHHSSMDVYDRIQAADTMQNAVIVASFVYHAANRNEKLPRKPLPEPPPQTTTTGDH